MLSVGCTPDGRVFLDPHIDVLEAQGRRVAFTVDGKRIVRDAAYEEDPMRGTLRPFVTVGPDDALLDALARGRTVRIGLDPDAAGLDDTDHPLAGAPEALGEALTACH